MMRAATLALVLVLAGCATAPPAEIPCHTDTECHEYAVEQGWPEEWYP